MFSVTLYCQDRVFGGHEEGGWWFDCGEPVAHWLNRVFKTREEAAAYYESEAVKLEETRLNEGLAEISSVNCEGIWGFKIDQGLAKPYPDRRPHYE